jgi:hypothetical protein
MPPCTSSVDYTAIARKHWADREDNRGSSGPAGGSKGPAIRCRRRGERRGSVRRPPVSANGGAMCAFEQLFSGTSGVTVSPFHLHALAVEYLPSVGYSPRPYISSDKDVQWLSVAPRRRSGGGGALTAMSPPSVLAGEATARVVVSPDGKSVHASNRGTTTSGALPGRHRHKPDGKSYVADHGSGSVSEYLRTPSRPTFTSRAGMPCGRPSDRRLGSSATPPPPWHAGAAVRPSRSERPRRRQL